MLAKRARKRHDRPMTQQTPFQQNVVSFLRELEGGNKSTLTLTAYKTDLLQFFQWLTENDVTVMTPDQVTRGHINEYLAFLSSQGRSGSPEHEN
jgi:site-specific recombinase XerD